MRFPMNEAKQTQQEDAIDFLKLARAIRFALVAMVIGFSYLGLRASLVIKGFGKIYEDMLGRDERLPVLTTFVLNARFLFVTISILIFIIAVATLFSRRLVRSVYIIGVVGASPSCRLLFSIMLCSGRSW